MSNPGPFESEPERRAAWLEYRKTVIAARKAHQEKIAVEGLAAVVPPELPMDPPPYWGKPSQEGQVVEVRIPNPLAPTAGTITAEQTAAMLGGDREVIVPGEAVAAAIGQQSPPPQQPSKPPSTLDGIDRALGRWTRRLRHP